MADPLNKGLQVGWQAYVDTNMVGSGKISQGAILGQEGAIWAASPGLSISAGEQASIRKAFEDTEGTLALGLKIGGQKYFTLQANGRSIYLKKQSDGAIVVKTTQAILIGLYVAPIQAPEATSIVENLADYLISAGY
ncbi:profilin [Streptomyces sp. YGL11-2]|uniref:profilin n=1 Tax=Streptomyces sp. YGL11-2 TaxID=3414028 RepID=UPI003CF66406